MSLHTSSAAMRSSMPATNNQNQLQQSQSQNVPGSITLSPAQQQVLESQRAASRKYASMSFDDSECCPLCMEHMDASDCRFKPCPCGYQVCRFCWHRIREEGNEQCPACRRQYTDEDAVYLPEDSVHSSSSSSAVSSKTSRRTKTPVSVISASSAPSSPTSATGGIAAGGNSSFQGVIPSRRHLIEIRVIQRNLVYVIGIPTIIANETILSEKEFFGQFGKILKIVVNKRGGPASAAAVSNGNNGSAYVTFARAEDAVRAIQYVDGSDYDGRVLRATFGTTKYCSYFLRGTQCPNPGCMYLHMEGAAQDSFTKEELGGGKLHQHSSVSDRTGVPTGPRHFGTVMYHPDATMAKPVLSVASDSVITTSNGISISSWPRDSNTTTASVEVLTSTSNGVTGKTSTSSGKYAEEALSFLDRLVKWEHRQTAEIESVFEDPETLQSASNRSRGDSTASASASSGTLLHRQTLTKSSFTDLRSFDPFAPMELSLIQQRSSSPTPSSSSSSSSSSSAPSVVVARPNSTGPLSSDRNTSNGSTPTVRSSTPPVHWNTAFLSGFDWVNHLVITDDVSSLSSSSSSSSTLQISDEPRSMQKSSSSLDRLYHQQHQAGVSSGNIKRNVAAAASGMPLDASTLERQFFIKGGQTEAALKPANSF